MSCLIQNNSRLNPDNQHYYNLNYHAKFPQAERDKVKGGCAMSGNTSCPCEDYSCELHPSNHDKGCDLCVADSVNTREIPKCFFMKVTKDLDGITDWSFESFAGLVLNEGQK